MLNSSLTFFIKLWHISKAWGSTRTYTICNFHHKGHCLRKYSDRHYDLDCPGRWNVFGEAGRWNFVPAYDHDGYTWKKIFAIDNSNNPNPIHREGRLRVSVKLIKI